MTRRAKCDRLSVLGDDDLQRNGPLIHPGGSVGRQSDVFGMSRFNIYYRIREPERRIRSVVGDYRWGSVWVGQVEREESSWDWSRTMYALDRGNAFRHIGPEDMDRRANDGDIGPDRSRNLYKIWPFGSGPNCFKPTGPICTVFTGVRGRIGRRHRQPGCAGRSK